MSHKPKKHQNSTAPAGKVPSAAHGALSAEPSVAAVKPMVSIHDVARRGGVSIATVSRVVNNEAQGVSAEAGKRRRATHPTTGILTNRIN